METKLWSLENCIWGFTDKPGGLWGTRFTLPLEAYKVLQGWFANTNLWSLPNCQN